ncbi:outer membrane protein assembly factor BamB family protein [Nocardia sp. JW2]|uniref:outer membrane protein assembly factor BamB family protein n=1 Tax=Nocardia sp. JW2 TaxID=3450738 RepID=UPI003F41C5C8
MQADDPPAVSGNSVFAASVGGVVCALDATTGAVRWRTAVGNAEIPHAPIAVGPRVCHVKGIGLVSWNTDRVAVGGLTALK